MTNIQTPAAEPTNGRPTCPEGCGPVYITVGAGTPHERQIRTSCDHVKEAERLQYEREERERLERDRYNAIRACINDYHRIAGPPRMFLDLKLPDVDERECSAAGKAAGVFYADNFMKHGGDGYGLTLAGAIGTGKTMVAVAIANTLAARGVHVRFITTTDLQAKMRDWDAAAETMRDLKRAGLVVLDDLGVERITEFTCAGLFDLLNARYQNRRPTILTTNLGAKMLRQHYIRSLTRGNDQMPADQAAITVDRILSRIRERNAHVLFEGPDQRAGTVHTWLTP